MKIDWLSQEFKRSVCGSVVVGWGGRTEYSLASQSYQFLWPVADGGSAIVSLLYRLYHGIISYNRYEPITNSAYGGYSPYPGSGNGLFELANKQMPF